MIELCREWVKKGGTIPVGVLATFDQMVAQDARLSIYFFHRSLKFPLLKKAILAQRFVDVEDAYDESSMIEPTPPKIGEVMKPHMMTDRMYH